MENREPLASEMYADLKEANKYKEKLIYRLIIIILVLVFALFGSNIYHIYQWSQFETVVVDSGEGYGNANYVQGENSGGIYNGESLSPQTEEGQNQRGAD